MKAPAMSPISVVVPTLNEADNLPLLFERIYTSLHSAHIPFEIIVVDDHSTDATAAITRVAAPKYHARLLMKQGKPGKAYSLQQGFKAAKHDLICMIDADLQYPPEAISRMYHKMVYCNADIVITNRVEQQTSGLRKFVSKGFHLVFTRALFGINYDTQSGLKLFKKEVLRDLQIAPSAWTFDLEFVVRSLERKYVILSENIAFAERNAGMPKIHIVSASLEMAWQSLKLRRRVTTKHVKGQYRTLKPLQQSFNWLAVLAIGLIVALSVPTQPAQALQLPSLQDVVSRLLPQKSQPPATPQASTPAVTAPAAATPTPSTSSPAVTATPTPATTTSAPSATSSPASPRSTTSQPSTANSAVNASNANAATSTLQTSNGKQDSYYPSAKLSQNKTNTWLNVASRALVIGLSVLSIGVLLFSIRKMIRRMDNPSRQQQGTL